MEFAQFTSPTLVTRERDAVRAFHAEHQDIILKPLDGMGGMGIFRVKADGLNLGSIVETLNKNGAQTIMVQRFVPEIAQGDKRILVIGGKPVPFSLARIPQGTRSARQPGGRRQGRGAAADGARLRDRRTRSARCWPRAGCCWSGWMSSATG